MPLPPKIANAPELGIGLQIWYVAFFELNSCRSTGFGLGPIPWTAIADYARAFDFDQEQFEDLVYFVRVLDAEYLRFHHQKQDREIRPGNKGKKHG